MLHKVGANFAVIETLSQAAEGEIEIGKKRVISILDDETIEEGKGVYERATILVVTRPIADLGGNRERGRKAFQVDRRRVAGRV